VDDGGCLSVALNMFAHIVQSGSPALETGFDTGREAGGDFRGRKLTTSLSASGRNSGATAACCAVREPGGGGGQHAVWFSAHPPPDQDTHIDALSA